MKKVALRCLSLMILMICALAITSCSRWGNPYNQYDKEEKNISVKYLANGGIINSGADALVDVFSKNETGSIKILPPESAETPAPARCFSRPWGDFAAGTPPAHWETG